MPLVTVDAIVSGRAFAFAALPPHATVAWLLSEVMRRDADADDAEGSEEAEEPASADSGVGCAGAFAFGITAADGTALDMEADAADVMTAGATAVMPANAAAVMPADDS